MELFGAENGEFEYKGTQYEIPYLEFKHDVGLRDMNWASQIMKGCSHLGMSQHTEEKMSQSSLFTKHSSMSGSARQKTRRYAY